jgi:hypothetical protein
VLVAEIADAVGAVDAAEAIDAAEAVPVLVLVPETPCSAARARVEEEDNDGINRWPPSICTRLIARCHIIHYTLLHYIIW